MRKSFYPNQLWKTIKFLYVFFLFPVFLSAQELSGLWTGTLVNDSTKKVQNYELALSEYRGNVTGYSYTTFISNDTFYFSIKRMKATKKDSIWIVEDDKMVGNNFPRRPDKGVRQINTFSLNKKDSSWQMDGNWKTTESETKKYIYYSISGSIKMKEEKDLKKSSLIAHLEELNLQNTVAFYQENKKITEPVKKSEPVIVKASRKELKDTQLRVIKNPLSDKGNIKPLTLTPVAEIKETKIISQPEKKEELQVARLPEANNLNSQTTSLTENKEKINKKPETNKQKPLSPEVGKKETVSKTNPVADLKKNEDTSLKLAKTEQVITIVPVLPSIVSIRKNENIQDIFFKSDSLVLTLYDNGIVDGDTVSVFLNGQNIIEKQKLKEVAVKKTIYIPQGLDSLQLVLFAENLGTIPPNTGLLVIRDADESYQVRFSADMQKNAALILKRKPNQ